ncbi:MAG: dihydrofolate reductase [Candidatus Nanohaloarchaea archaeon]
MEKVIIAALDEDRVIGKDGDVPWHYPEDVKHFRETTMGSPVVMGRKTYESLPEDYRPLPGRTNIVLTRSGKDYGEETRKAGSLEEAWEEAEKTGEDTVYIIGGESVYRQTLEQADRMVLTEIPGEHDGDTYFPDWDGEDWRETSRDDIGDLSIVEYTRV